MLHHVLETFLIFGKIGGGVGETLELYRGELEIIAVPQILRSAISSGTHPIHSGRTSLLGSRSMCARSSRFDCPRRSTVRSPKAGWSGLIRRLVSITTPARDGTERRSNLIHERGGSSCPRISTGSKRAVNGPDPIFVKTRKQKELL
jgi:hypothetical protein